MRLIDVDEAIKSFEKYDSFMGEPLTERDAHLVECVLTIFDLWPTAYSVEAVVKELEQEKFVSYLKDDVAAMEHNLTLNKAIAIVKRGGRNE